MRFLKWIAVLALLAVAAGWGAGQLIAQRLAAALSGDGPATAETVRATGFPARIGVDMDALTVPFEGGAWQVPRLSASAPLWAPLHWAVAPALPQQLTFGQMRFALTADTASGGIELAPGIDLPVAGATAHLVAPALTYEAAAVPSLAARSLDLTLRRGDGYALEARIAGLSFPEGLMASLTPQAKLPDAIDSITLRGTLGLDHPLALAGAPARLTMIAIDDGQLLWGGRALAVSGRVTIGAEGTPEGTMTFTTRDWRDWLEFAIGGRLVDPGLEQILTTLAGLMAQQSPDGTLTLPLTFRDGRMSLGPVPLGPAPRLGQRQ